MNRFATEYKHVLSMSMWALKAARSEKHRGGSVQLGKQ